MLVVAGQGDPVLHISAQQQLRSTHDKIRIDLLALRSLTRNTLQSILIALRVDGGDQRRGSAIALKRAGSMCISVPKRIAQKRFRSMRRNHWERKIDDCQDPKTFSMTCDLPQSAAG